MLTGGGWIRNRQGCERTWFSTIAFLPIHIPFTSISQTDDMESIRSAHHAKHPRKAIFVVGLLVALFGFRASAQYENGSLVGTIHDATGAVVANANVSVTNIGTGIVTSVTTNASGDYAVPSLRVGSYSIKAEAPGFAPVEAQAAIRAVRQRSTRRIWT